MLGPWVPYERAAAAERVDLPRKQHVYLSLVHWYESAKFMPHMPHLREAALYSPSIKEVRKFARKRQPEWRSDWALTRHSVLVAGLAMLCIQRRELGLREAQPAAIAEALASMELPQRFLDACIQRFATWRDAPRISIFGADIAPDEVVGVRLAKLVPPLANWTLVTSCHRSTPWRLHDWALVHYVPVQYYGARTDRSSRPLAAQLISGSDQVIVFEQRRNKRLDHVIQAAKSLKKKVSLELYDGQTSEALRLV